MPDRGNFLATALLSLVLAAASADVTGLQARLIGKPRAIDPIESLTSLAETEVCRSGPRTLPRLALTIDDGWVADDALLELLVAYGIKCTVFIPGRVADERPGFIRKLDALGFEVANHGYSHHVITAMSDEEIEMDLRRGQAAITRITGKTLPFFRPSGGAINARARRIVARLGYKLVLWDNDLHGYSAGSSLSAQLEYARKNLRNGSIILSHFGARLKTADVLKTFIPEALGRGFSFVTLSRLLEPAQ
jgi:peptidoglycan/xylan/chitin deacetylase (PgdA/CDA1 family)